MKKIDRLTPDQQELLASELEHWQALCRSTEPLDRAAATEAICALYRAIGKKPPVVLFFSSPLMCIFAWDALRVRVPQRWHQKMGRRWLEWIMRALDRIEAWVDPALREWARSQYVGRGLGSHVVGWITRVAADQLEGLAVLYDPRWEVLYGQLDAPLRQQLNRLGELDSHLRWDFLQLRWHPDEQLWERLRRRLGQELAEQLGDRPVQELMDPLRDLLVPWVFEEGKMLEEQIEKRGAWAASYQVLGDFCNRIGVACGPRTNARLQLWVKQSQHCHWWFPYQRVVLASERPSVLTVDSAGRLHSSSGAALEYADGYRIYAWHGVRVEPRLIVDPASITVSEIEHETNAEIRRIKIERYGWTRYIADCGARVVDSIPMDHPIVGLRGARLLVKHLDGEPEPIVYLEMVNSSVEADGTCKRYLERIDPKAYDGDAGRLCHAAMASRRQHRDDQGRLVRTFERWQDYVPTAES